MSRTTPTRISRGSSAEPTQESKDKITSQPSTQTTLPSRSYDLILRSPFKSKSPRWQTGLLDSKRVNIDLNAEFSNFDASTSKISVDTPVTQSELRYVALPAVFDYRQKGKVTPVKNQKGCGSSWAFVATSIYESALLIHGQGEYDLAE